MKRMFLPVGQGAFYCERFSPDECGRRVNVVYDCGSVSGLSHVKKVIDKLFKDAEVIDALFISHLHEDHINGIPFLMARCQVNRVYLPLINLTDLALMRLDFETRNRPSLFLDKVLLGEAAWMVELFVRRMLEHPQDALSELAQRYNRVIAVSELDCFTDEIAQDGLRTNSVKDLSDEVFIGAEMKSDNMVWRYKTFCIRNDEAVKSVLKRFRELFSCDATPEQIAELIKDGCKDREMKKKIRGLYNIIKGEFNLYSLTMCSESCNSGCRQMVGRELCNGNMKLYELPNNVASGCLYTGDFDASNLRHWYQIKTAYNDNWENLGCLQVPHHGSPYSFNAEMLKDSWYHVISAGFGNQHHHPSRHVLGQYQRANIFPFVVTQDPRSMFCTDVNCV